MGGYCREGDSKLSPLLLLFLLQADASFSVFCGVNRKSSSSYQEGFMH